MAKNTDIIVADEPTGNLDSENGIKIMELLYKLSKDKLVIVVTHNAEQIEALATRKIRMYDGCIAADHIIKRAESKSINNSINKNSGSDEIQHKKDNENSRLGLFIQYICRFILNNIGANPKRFIIITLLLLTVVMSSFIFLGQIAINFDDASTKIMKNITFRNNASERIAVRNPDGSALTDEQIKQLEAIPNVKLFNKYGASNDVNYFYRKGIDYTYSFNSYEANLDKTNPVNPENSEYIRLRNKNNFVLSVNNMTKDDLRAGRLPTEYNEIVLYANDEASLNQTILFYFNNEFFWKETGVCYMNMKVVGLLKKPTQQVYFSDKLSAAFSAGCHLLEEKELCFMNSHDKKVYSKGVVILSYVEQDDEIKSNVIISNELSAMYFLTYNVKLILNEYINADYKNPVNSIELENISTEYHYNSSSFIYVGEDMFNQIYDTSISYQASLFADNKARVEEIADAAKKMGLQVANLQKLNKGNYDLTKVRERLIIILICSFAILVIYALEILIIKLLLRLNKDDILILKFIGLSNKLICSVNYIEMLLYLFIAIALSAATIVITNMLKINSITNIILFYTPLKYFILIALNIFVVVFNAYDYNKYLCKKSKITALRED